MVTPGRANCTGVISMKELTMSWDEFQRVYVYKINKLHTCSS